MLHLNRLRISVASVLRQISCVWLALLLMSVAPWVQAADASDVAGSAPFVTHLPFSRLGAFEPIHLTGTHNLSTVGVGIRIDRVVTSARLHLVYAASPALVPSISHIKVLVNKQAVASIPLNQPGATQGAGFNTFDVPLDPRMFTGFNQVTLQLVGHYTINQCEDPANTAIWTDINPSSELVLEQRPVVLPDDLALLPAPFFDVHDNTRLVLPFMLGTAPGNERLRSAGVLASWFGKLAGYRGVQFPVVHDFPARDNAILLATADQLPADLPVGPVRGPTLMVLANPVAPDRKILLITGRTEQDIQTAVYGLVLGRALLTGQRVEVGQVDIGPARKPYDAPKWLSLKGPVRLGDLVSDPSQLQASGVQGTPIRIDMPVPADLFEWSGRGIPLDLKYRYTAPSTVNDSVLNVDINNLLIKSYRLTPRSPEKGAPEVSALRLPMLSDDGSGAAHFVDIPSFRIGSSNELELSFSLDSQKSGLCAGAGGNPARAAVDPSSTIDFSGMAHYAMMPNLGLFAGSGFPYTRMADLSDTDVVLPEHADAADIELMLEVLGHMGDWTGLPALRVGVIRSNQVGPALDKDLIVIGSGESASLLPNWNHMAPLRITGVKAGSGAATTYSVSLEEPASESGDGKAHERGVELSGDGSLGAILGMQSPFHPGRSLVALIGTNPQSLRNVSQVLADPGTGKFISGGLALVRGTVVQSMPLGPQYAVGYLPWYARVWIVAAAHPLLLAIASVLAGILVAMGLFMVLQSVAGRRRRG